MVPNHFMRCAFVLQFLILRENRNISNEMLLRLVQFVCVEKNREEDGASKVHAFPKVRFDKKHENCVVGFLMLRTRFSNLNFARKMKN